MIYGSWPENYDEVVLIVDQNNEVSDLVLYTLGLRSEEELTDSLRATWTARRRTCPSRAGAMRTSAASFKLVGYYDKYVYDAETGGYTDVSGSKAGLDYLYENEDVGVTLKISGIVRQNPDAVAGMMQSGAIGYTAALTDYVIEDAADSDVIVDQMANPDVDVLTGLPFLTGDEPEPRLEEIRPRRTATSPRSTTADSAELYRELHRHAGGRLPRRRGGRGRLRPHAGRT